MVAITSLATSARHSVQQSAVPQVRRVAEQAQQAADQLQAQARDAWQKVDIAEANARALDARADQAVSTAAQAKQGLVAFGAKIQAADNASLIDTSATAPKGADNGSAVYSTTIVQPLFPAVNAQGQRLGTFINVTA